MHRDTDPYFWPDGTVKSQGNAFTAVTGSAAEAVRREQIAKEAGAKSAATKRSRGKAVMPRLYLRGSKFKEAA